MPKRSPIVRAVVPVPVEQALDAAAKSAGMTRSALIREFIIEALRARGLWPPHSDLPA